MYRKAPDFCTINFVSCNYHPFSTSLHSIPNCELDIFASMVVIDINVYFFKPCQDLITEVVYVSENDLGSVLLYFLLFT